MMTIKSDETEELSGCAVLECTLPGLIDSPTLTIKALHKARISLCPECKPHPVKVKVKLTL
jgi:hypothetical protein